jgi:bifunctional UDP-N-acetylglucosamine pyrophosphorylase / glucosamine-1-phosphate N-acetyltransferase
MAVPAMRLCAVVPAAGRGTRLCGNMPKLLAPLGRGATVWSVLSRKLLAIVDHVSLIVSPTGLSLLKDVIARDGLDHLVSLSVQPTPIGMGNAIFCGAPVWSQATTLLIVWGDQVFVAEETLRRACALHRHDPATLVLPLVEMEHPYVEYCFDPSGRLTAVKQNREGEQCSAYGYADVGTFVLSVGGLQERWRDYRADRQTGALTSEINFLPFLPWLMARGWACRCLTVADAREARGVNTPEDLAFFQSIMDARQGSKETCGG